MKSTSSVYFPRIDHLRFLAALMVFSWHSLHHHSYVPFTTVPTAFPFSLFEEGHTGVAMFLTLSGFIFALLSDEKDIDYWSFVRNRLLRIVPLFIVFTLAVFYTSAVPPERLFVAIFALLDRGVYPSVGWTVLLEFQLYLAFPFLLAFTRRYGLRYLFGVMGIAALFRLGVFLDSGSAQFLSYWTVFGRIDQFVCGMLAFAAYRRAGRVLGHPLVFALGAVGWMLAYHEFNKRGGWYSFGGDSPKSSVWLYLPTVEGVAYGFLIASYLSLNVKIPRPVDRFLAWLGTLTYSLYLSHPMIVSACFGAAKLQGYAPRTLEDVTFFTFFVVLPILVACSALTYYVIEVPFLTMRRPYTTPRASAQRVERQTV